MKQKNIGVNAILNVVRKCITLIFPIVTLPYAIRVLGINNIGKVNYGHSIITYFNLIAMLGVSQYAIREGSKKKDDKQRFSQFASEVFTINLLSTALAYILLIITIVCVSKLHNYKYLLLLQSISIILTTFSVDWINSVFEDFLLITVRSILAYVVMFVFLLVFVKKPEDYYLYALLTVISDAIICITNKIYCRRYVVLRPTTHPNFKKHFKSIMIFFANAVAILIYVSIDTTMLGWIKGDYDVGLYSLAVKVYVAVKSLMIAIYNVSIPRLAYLWGINKKEEFKNLLTDLFGYISVLLVPATIGLIMIAEPILILLGGEEYIKSVSTLQILSVALFFAIFGGLVCDCLNVAIGREKENMIAAISAAFINFALNLVLIPAFSYIGAAITTLIAEAFVTFFCFLRIPNKEMFLQKQRVIRSLLHAFIGSLIMVAISFAVQKASLPVFVKMVTTIFVSSVVYVVFMFFARDYYVLNILSMIRNRIKYPF